MKYKDTWTISKTNKMWKTPIYLKYFQFFWVVVWFNFWVESNILQTCLRNFSQWSYDIITYQKLKLSHNTKYTGKYTKWLEFVRAYGFKYEMGGFHILLGNVRWHLLVASRGLFQANSIDKLHTLTRPTANLIKGWRISLRLKWQTMETEGSQASLIYTSFWYSEQLYKIAVLWWT